MNKEPKKDYDYFERREGEDGTDWLIRSVHEIVSRGLAKRLEQERARHVEDGGRIQ